MHPSDPAVASGRAAGDVGDMGAAGPAVVAVTVHGDAGSLDLVVPAGASARDVAGEYATQAGLAGPTPRLVTGLGTPVADDADVAALRSGSLLVAVGAGTSARPGGRRRRAAGRHSRRPGPTGPPDATTDRTADGGAPAAGTAGAPETAGSGSSAVVAWCTVAVALALLAALTAAVGGDAGTRRATALVLGLAGLVALVPVGRWAVPRALSAPAFVGGAALVVAWSPAPERLPTVLGVAALAAAVAAAVGRSLQGDGEEGLRVWMVAGSLVFTLAASAALLGLGAATVWATLLVVALLAARFVPQLAVDVPDQYLLDLERLAVTAWSARERPVRRRGRTVVPREAVARVAARGARLVTAGSAAVAVVAATAAPLLLATATLPLDRIGARCLVGFAGAGLLLAARSYRHAAARALLRAGGLVCWLALALAVLGLLGLSGQWWVVVGSTLLAALLVVVGVAVGRGWRSAWWSQRAETAEAVAGAFALASLVVAVGLFRHLWEITG